MSNFVRGKVSKTIQYTPFLRSKKTTSSIDYHTWCSRLIRLLITSHLSSWYIYNEKKHANDTSVDISTIREIIETSRQHDFDVITRNWFELTPTRISQLIPQQIQHWIEQARLLIKAKKKEKDIWATHDPCIFSHKNIVCANAK